MEDTWCVVLPTGNAQPVDIARFDATLIAGTHHMIFYATDEAVNETPTRCNPFSGVIPGFGTSNGMAKALTITQSPHEVLTFPVGVAYQFKANQNVRVEIHFINASSSPVMGKGKMDVYKYAGTPENRADLIFGGNININIPPQGTPTFGGTTNLSPGDKIFSLTGHTHHLGTRFAIDHVSGTASRQVYESLDWEHPPYATFDPPLSFAQGERLRYSCSFFNPATTGRPVTLGESFYDEMCFYWAYYYPSRGFLFLPNL